MGCVQLLYLSSSLAFHVTTRSSACSCYRRASNFVKLACVDLLLPSSQVGQLRSNKPATLYTHPDQSYVVSLCSSPDGRAILSGDPLTFHSHVSCACVHWSLTNTNLRLNLCLALLPQVTVRALSRRAPRRHHLPFLLRRRLVWK